MRCLVAAEYIRLIGLIKKANQAKGFICPSITFGCLFLQGGFCGIYKCISQLH